MARILRQLKSKGHLYCQNTKGKIVKATEKVANEIRLLIGSASYYDQAMSHQIGEPSAGTYLTVKHHEYYDSTKQEINYGKLEQEIVSFISNGVTSPLQQKAKISQGAGFGVNVQLADDNTFSDLVASSAPVFVMFYTTWCGNCRPLKPVFSRLATALKSANSPAKAIAVDVGENARVADIAHIDTIPMFKLFKKGQAVSTYEGNRSFEDMFSFISSHMEKNSNTSNNKIESA